MSGSVNQFSDCQRQILPEAGPSDLLEQRRKADFRVCTLSARFRTVRHSPGGRTSLPINWYGYEGVAYLSCIDDMQTAHPVLPKKHR